jgi:hypothetical protein
LLVDEQMRPSILNPFLVERVDGHEGVLRHGPEPPRWQQQEISVMNEAIGKVMPAPKGQMPPAVSRSEVHWAMKPALKMS